jgi:hypothetical protein
MFQAIGISQADPSWESALRAINGLLTGLRVDDTDFTADDPPTRAALLLRRLITVAHYHAATTHLPKLVFMCIF